MTVTTITMDQEKARQEYLKYRSSIRERMTNEDIATMRGYKALAKGYALLDLVQAFQQVGLDHQARPRFAIARAHWKRVYLVGHQDGSAEFHSKRDTYNSKVDERMYIPQGTFPEAIGKHNASSPDNFALVPLVPVFLHPTFPLKNYHVAWEPEWQERPPSDPMLCKHLSGMLFTVIATWDLTGLEKAILRGR